MNNFLRILSLNAARLLFVGGLLLALYVGLRWSLSPEARPDAASIAAAEAALEAAASESESPSEAPPTAEASVAPVAPPTEIEPTTSPEEFIARAKPPGETTVQVLDAGGGGAQVDAAISVLEQLGYQVIAVSPSSRDVTSTTVYFTAEAEAEAEALRARDPRFQQVEANRGLSEGVDIHVLVGPGFQS